MLDLERMRESVRRLVLPSNAPRQHVLRVLEPLEADHRGSRCLWAPGVPAERQHLFALPQPLTARPDDDLPVNLIRRARRDGSDGEATYGAAVFVGTSQTI